MDEHSGEVSDRAGMTCPVCRTAQAQHFLQIDGRDYWRCMGCAARFLDPRQHPSPEQESSEYEKHRNDTADARYRRFLNRLAEPLLERLQRRSQGLDYGCGPGPVLAEMLREHSHQVALYDPFFQPEPGSLRRRYDFITCTETAEHFHRPAEEFDRLGALLRPGGWLALMTCFQTDDCRFAGWHYRRDPTHVVFYREDTLRHIAAERGWSCIIPTKDVALMRRPPAAEMP